MDAVILSSTSPVPDKTIVLEQAGVTVTVTVDSRHAQIEVEPFTIVVGVPVPSV